MKRFVFIFFLVAVLMYFPSLKSAVSLGFYLRAEGGTAQDNEFNLYDENNQLKESSKLPSGIAYYDITTRLFIQRFFIGYGRSKWYFHNGYSDSEKESWEASLGWVPNKFLMFEAGYRNRTLDSTMDVPKGYRCLTEHNEKYIKVSIILGVVYGTVK